MPESFRAENYKTGNSKLDGLAPSEKINDKGEENMNEFEAKKKSKTLRSFPVEEAKKSIPAIDK